MTPHGSVSPPRWRYPRWWIPAGWVLAVALGVAGLVELGLIASGAVRSEPFALLAVALPLAGALLIIGLQRASARDHSRG